MRQKSHRGGLVTLIILFLVVGGGWLKRSALYDWMRLRNYQPPSQVMQLEAETSMTPPASRLFYVNHPKILDKDNFNTKCPNNGGEQTIVLGCYHGHQTGIFLFTVSDPQLNGVMQVTAAHEMLHAIYDRLSPKQKNYINRLLRDYYDNDLQDPRLLTTIAAYQKSEPNDLLNEMHSIFGTEVVKLPASLETYYAQYFSNRTKVVSYSQQYESAFSSRKASADSIMQRINAIKQQLDALQPELDNRVSDLKNRRQDLESSLHSTQPEVDAYNAKVNIYNDELGQYKGRVEFYNQLIVDHNQLVADYQRIAVEASQLIKELDSRSSTVNRH